MDFAFIENLRLLLENGDVFGWSFLMAGCKAMALALLMFKLLNQYISDFDTETPKLGNIFNIIGYACMIMSCDWIIGFIETIFGSIDVSLNKTPSNMYAHLYEIMEEHAEKLADDDLDAWSFIKVPIGAITTVFYGIILNVLIGIFKIADLAITASYLLLRLFLLELTKLLFPIVIALSTLDITKDLLGKWIKRYIGLFILGLVYIAIINFCSVIEDTLMKEFSVLDSENGEQLLGMGNAMYGACITIVVVFTFKIKVLSMSTSYISNFFS